MKPGLVSIQVRPGNPDFLDLPWEHSLAHWAERTPRLLRLQRGLARHEVLFCDYDAQGIYAVKELPVRLAEREYELLRELESRRLPAVTAAGLARTSDASGEELGVLITRFLEHSLPYRTLFMQQGLERYRESLLDAIASLLVELHLAGVYWGDCSLSNTLFRRDAGELQAYLVDAETSETHESLSSGQRQMDLMIMEENVAGEIADVAAIGASPDAVACGDLGASIRSRYERLWHEVTREEVIGPGERFRIQERIRALNELGFSVGEIELVDTGSGEHLRMHAVVTDRDHHRTLLHSLTGLVAEERQAAQLLNEIREMRATLTRSLGRSLAMSVAAARWREERFDPTIAKLRQALGTVADPCEMYCQVLEHKWFLSERARRDVGLEPALEDYVRTFRGAPARPETVPPAVR